MLIILINYIDSSFILNMNSHPCKEHTFFYQNLHRHSLTFLRSDRWITKYTYISIPFTIYRWNFSFSLHKELQIIERYNFKAIFYYILFFLHIGTYSFSKKKFIIPVNEILEQTALMYIHTQSKASHHTWHKKSTNWTNWLNL